MLVPHMASATRIETPPHAVRDRVISKQAHISLWVLVMIVGNLLPLMPRRFKLLTTIQRARHCHLRPLEATTAEAQVQNKAWAVNEVSLDPRDRRLTRTTETTIIASMPLT